MNMKWNLMRLNQHEENDKKKKGIALKALSYPNFIRGQLFVDMRVFAGHVEVLRANCHAIRKIS